MEPVKNRWLSWFVALLLVASASGAALGDVASPVDRVDIRAAGGGISEVIVRFLWPITLRSRPAAERGRSLQVELGFVPGGGALAGNSAMPPWRSSGDPAARGVYDAIRLDGALDSATLSMDLAGDYPFEVRRGADARSLVITVHHAPAGAPTARTPLPPVPRDVPVASAAARSKTVTEADRALAAGEMDRAIALYSKAAADPESPDAVEALEKLGVARERKGQLAQAKVVYQDYLRRYSESPDRARVAQRLEALLAIDRTVASRVGDTTPRKAARAPDWQVFGAWSQYYRYADQSIDRRGSQWFYGSEDYTAQSDLLSRLDTRARHLGPTWGVDARLGAGYLWDFRNGGDAGGARGSKTLLADANVEFTHLSSDITARIGRQYSSTDGVLGRFDGARVGLPIGGGWRVNVLGGRPVDLIYDTSVDDSDRYFYGASLNYRPEESGWEYGVFAMEQRIDGIEDRQAVGGELRYAAAGRSLFTLVDYDAGYAQLNTLLLIGNLTLDAGTMLGATVDYRESPVLTTRNALIGQPVNSIHDLLRDYSESEIRGLAEARTAGSHAMTLSLTQPLDERYQVYASVSEFEYGSTQTAGGVDGYEGTGAEYGYDLQFIASNLWLANDSHIFSLRYYDGHNSERAGLGINARYRIRETWRIQPRLWLERRESKRDGSDQWALRPSLRIEYQWRRRYHLELELGRDWSMRNIPLYGDEELSSNFYLLSYRVDFE
jgi:hypothetical protein